MKGRGQLDRGFKSPRLRTVMSQDIGNTPDLRSGVFFCVRVLVEGSGLVIPGGVEDEVPED